MTRAAHRAAASESQLVPDVVIVRPVVNENEAAAIIAVVGAAFAREAWAARGWNRPANLWERSRSRVPAPIVPGTTRWRGFSG